MDVSIARRSRIIGPWLVHTPIYIYLITKRRVYYVQSSTWYDTKPSIWWTLVEKLRSFTNSGFLINFASESTQSTLNSASLSVYARILNVTGQTKITFFIVNGQKANTWSNLSNDGSDFLLYLFFRLFCTCYDRLLDGIINVDIKLPSFSDSLCLLVHDDHHQSGYLLIVDPFVYLSQEFVQICF